MLWCFYPSIHWFYSIHLVRICPYDTTIRKWFFCNEYVALRGVSFVKQLIVVIHCINFHLLSPIFIPTSLDAWSPISWFRQSTPLCYLVLGCCLQRLGRCIYCTCLLSGSLVKCPLFSRLWETTVGCFDLMHLLLMPFPIISWIMTEDNRTYGPCHLKSWETFYLSPILFCWSILSEIQDWHTGSHFPNACHPVPECLTHITTCWFWVLIIAFVHEKSLSYGLVMLGQIASFNQAPISAVM